MKDDHAVLIVTGDESAGKNIAAILNKISVRSSVVSTGTDALSSVEDTDTPFSLIFTDQTLPDMKGTDLLERVSRVVPDAFRFLAADHADITAIVDAVNRGKIHKYIAKPWQAEQLRGDIRAGLKQYELIMESEALFHVAKGQNIKLFNLNRDLKQSAERQTKELEALEENIQKTREKLKQSPQLFDSKALLEMSRSVEKMIKSTREKQHEMGNRLYFEMVKLLYAQFNEIAVKNGFELRSGN